MHGYGIKRSYYEVGKGANSKTNGTKRENRQRKAEARRWDDDETAFIQSIIDEEKWEAHQQEMANKIYFNPESI